MVVIYCRNVKFLLQKTATQLISWENLYKFGSGNLTAYLVIIYPLKTLF